MLQQVKTPGSGDNGGTKAAMTPNPFTKASKRLTEPFYDNTIALGASAQQLQQIEVPATGYLRSIVLDVELSGTTGATYNPDAPYNVLEQVQLADVNGQPLVQLSGYDLFLSQLFGGYAFHADPTDYPGYSLGATGARFQLRIPVEIVQRNGLGALPNMNASMLYKIKMSLAPIADVYATSGTGATVRIRATVESWSNPQPQDLNGVPNSVRPPADGTAQNWSEYVSNVVVGLNTIRLPRVGNIIRNLVFVNRDATGARTDTGIPDDLRLMIDGNIWKHNSFAYEQQRIFELYGYGSADRPAGVWVLPLTDDFDGTPGQEIGDLWLATTGATRLELQGTFSAIGSLTVMTNDILAWADSASGPGQTLGA